MLRHPIAAIVLKWTKGIKVITTNYIDQERVRLIEIWHGETEMIKSRETGDPNWQNVSPTSSLVSVHLGVAPLALQLLPE